MTVHRCNCGSEWTFPPRGPAGADGPAGPVGPAGPQGDPGVAYEVSSVAPAGTDWNTIDEPGLYPFLIAGSEVNGPPNVYHYYVTVFVYGGSSARNCTQVAYPYNGPKIWTRFRYNDEWGDWTES